MKCSKCGAETLDDFQVCPVCGAPINTPDTQKEMDLKIEQVDTNPLAGFQVEELDNGLDSYIPSFETPGNSQVNIKVNSAEPVEEIKSDASNPLGELVEESVDDSFGVPTFPQVTPPAPEPKPEPRVQEVVPHPVSNNIYSTESESMYQAPEPSLDAAPMPEVPPVADIEPEPIVAPIVEPEPEPEPIPEFTAPVNPVTPSEPEISKASVQPNFASSVNKVTMANDTEFKAPFVNKSIDPSNQYTGEQLMNKANSSTFSDLLNDNSMRPSVPDMNNNSFGQPNFDQYSINMMYGSNTEEEQLKRMNAQNLNTQFARQNNPSPVPTQPQNIETPTPDAPVQDKPNVKEPKPKKKSGVGKFILIILILAALGLGGYYVYVTYFANSVPLTPSSSNPIVSTLPANKVKDVNSTVEVAYTIPENYSETVDSTQFYRKFTRAVDVNLNQNTLSSNSIDVHYVPKAQDLVSIYIELNDTFKVGDSLAEYYKNKYTQLTATSVSLVSKATYNADTREYQFEQLKVSDPTTNVETLYDYYACDLGNGFTYILCVENQKSLTDAELKDFLTIVYDGSEQIISLNTTDNQNTVANSTTNTSNTNSSVDVGNVANNLIDQALNTISSQNTIDLENIISNVISH